jgi:AcrR family transcriptional regulator
MTTAEGLDQRSERKKRDILDAARRHFMTEGYASTGMEAVARDACVSTATLYSYFPSKADLFRQVVKEAADQFSDLMLEAVTVEGDPAEQLREFARAYGRFMGDRFVRSVFRLVAAERRRFTDVATYFYDRARADFGGTLIGILKRLDAEGRLHVPKPATAAGQLLGMIEHPVFLVPLVTGDETVARRPLDQICDEAVETFLARYAVHTMPAPALT